MNLRQQFIQFFTKKGHTELKFHSVVPKQDPSLLFVNSGMATMKSFFLGTAQPPADKVITVQPCLRVGGKHNDLEMVGRTTRHHTLFEMLGNFSFGAYGRNDVISMAWEFITKELKIDQSKLWVTIHPSDSASGLAWKNVGVPDDRILQVTENIWAAGDVGPRGFCTEIFYDFGPNRPGVRPDLGDTEERYIEIWNIVLMEECVKKDGTIEKLPMPCIDTGMGLERMEAVLYGSHDSYDSVIMKELVQLSGGGISARILADHARAIVFLIADGIQPGPCGRNYILRRIMRRALRHQIMLNKDNLLEHAALKTIELMEPVYPYLSHAKQNVIDIIQGEMSKFMTGWKNGSALLDIALHKLGTSKILPGDIAFTLYDTYGFPLDLTESICQEKDIQIDHDGFNSSMQIQRKNSHGNLSNQVTFEGIENLQDTIFIGYDHNECDAQIEALFNIDGSYTSTLSSGGWIVINQSPFYSESGGQASDRGFINDMSVTDIKKIGEVWIHKVERGHFTVGQTVKCIIDRERRALLRAHHSATHLLYAALSKCCEKMTVCSSSVDIDKFRIDITYAHEITPELCKKIDCLINRWIAEDLECKIEHMSFKTARDLGASVLPGSQYPETVRVVSIGNIDIELCCGTHVSRTSEIAGFKLIEAKSVGAGIKRFTAKAGMALIEYLTKYKNTLENVANDLGVAPFDVNKKVAIMTGKSIDQIIHQPISVQNHPNGIIHAVLDPKTSMKNVASKLLKDANIVICTSDHGSNGTALCMMKAHLNYDAKEIVKNCAEYCGGGKGGGNRLLAQYSIYDAKKLNSWVEMFVASIEK